jgi:hypothetical protein
MISVKMTSQGPQLDDGQDKMVVILPPKGQKQAVAAGGLPMLEVKMTAAGPQVQNLPTAQKAPPQIQGPQPAVSQPRRVLGGAPPVNKARVVRVAAPKQVELALPPVPEFTAEQLMLCRHLVGRYLADLSVVGPTAQVAVESVDVVAQSSVGSAEPAGSSVGSAESAEPAEPAGSAAQGSGSTEPAGSGGDAPAAAREAPGAVLVHFVKAMLETIDQALVAVAIRAEAAELAAAAPVSISPAVAAPVASIIPAAPSTSYVAGRVGGGPNGYSRAKRHAAQAPRRVPHAGELPVVQVKMDGGRAVVQNQTEVAAARAARLAQRTGATEIVSAPTDLDGISPG